MEDGELKEAIGLIAKPMSAKKAKKIMQEHNENGDLWLHPPCNS